jgi:hypothetical protein
MSAIAVLVTTFGAAIAPAPAVQPAMASAPQQLARRADNLSDLEPEVGIIQQVQQGDLMCYISFTDEFGKRRRVGATFELCENPRQYLNQRVRLVYGIRSVSDCQSAEPCGKSRRTHLVVRMDPVDQAGRPVSATDSVVLRNRNWTIAVGNRASWSGVNGTGNLTYRACNTRGECLNLAGGVVTCRNGICSTTWRNGAYSYTLNSPMTDGSTRSSSTLVVRQSGNVLQEITGLR